jgi:transcriptional regulator with XRE-family HTH domain
MLTDRLKEARKGMGLTQDKFAVVVGTNRVTLADYERGATTPPIATLERIATVTGKPVAWFFLGEGESLQSAGQFERALLALDRIKVAVAEIEADLAPRRRRGSTKIDPYFGRQDGLPGNGRHGTP